MTSVRVKQLISHAISVGESVTVNGWLKSIRVSKGGFSFLSVHDGSCFDSIQVIADESLGNYAQVTQLSAGCAVTISGVLKESQGRGQDYEIQASDVSLVGDVANPETYPIAKKRHTFEYLRTVAHLRPRTNTFGAMARLRHSTSAAVHNYFDERGFVWVNTPIITASDCEGAGELFRVSVLDAINGNNQSYENDFFGRETFLCVSGQLNVESFCEALTKVYTFGPTFRAENSHTARHLAEFWMIEPEIAFADLSDNADLAESFLKEICKAVVDRDLEDLEFFTKQIDAEALSRIQAIIDNDFVRLEYTDAINELLGVKKKFEFPVEWGLDLQSEHERFLTEEMYKAPVIVMNYPKEIKPFYMRQNDDGKTVAAMDVLVPGVGEIIGGSQREERLEYLDERMTDEMKEELWWYRDLRKYGTVPHAGFGVGFERILLYLTGMDNIRDAVPFPRVPHNASF